MFREKHESEFRNVLDDIENLNNENQNSNINSENQPIDSMKLMFNCNCSPLPKIG